MAEGGKVPGSALGLDIDAGISLLARLNRDIEAWRRVILAAGDGDLLRGRRQPLLSALLHDVQQNLR